MSVIISTLADTTRVELLHPLLPELFRYVRTHDLLHTPCGRIELDGDRLFINNVNPQCVTAAEQVLEVHRRYLDVHILLEGAPDNAGADKISEHLLKTVPGIQSVNHIHVWSLTSGRVLATLQVQPMEGVDVRSVMKQVEAELKTKFKIEHPTIGIDWDEVASCTLEEPNTAALSHAGHSH